MRQLLIYLGNKLSVRTYQALSLTTWLYLFISNYNITGSIFVLKFSILGGVIFISLTIALIVQTFIFDDYSIRFWWPMKRVKVGNQYYYLFLEKGYVNICIDMFFCRVVENQIQEYKSDDEIKEILKDMELKRLATIEEKRKVKEEKKKKLNFDKVYLSKEQERIDKINQIN